MTNEPCHEKTCFWGFSSMQVSNWTAQLHKLARVLTFEYRIYRNYTIYEVNNKDADQTVWKRRLIRVFCCMHDITGFVMTRLKSC